MDNGSFIMEILLIMDTPQQLVGVFHGKSEDKMNDLEEPYFQTTPGIKKREAWALGSAVP